MKLLGILAAALLSLPAAAQDTALGKTLYEANCESCHGAQAHGDGWLAEYLTHKPPRLTSLKREYGGVFPRELVVAVIDGRNQVKLHGPRDMPVWGQRFQRDLSLRPASEESVQRRIEALAAYLASIQE